MSLRHQRRAPATTAAGILLAITALLVAGQCAASSGNPADQPLWTGKKDHIVYNTCGCADSCWIAELRDRQTRRPKAALRCDCQQLYFKRAGQRERVIEDNCEAFENAEGNKEAIIRKTMGRLLHRRFGR